METSKTIGEFIEMVLADLKAGELRQDGLLLYSPDQVCKAIQQACAIALFPPK